jgi:dolichyl-phosphate beta-glucosyltransferase
MNTLSIVIPVYNEEKRLQFAFKALEKGLNFDGIKVEEVIFVNDGSKDNTLQILKETKGVLEKSANVAVAIISYRKNKGKGYAVRKGMLASKADYTLLMDVDMSTPLNQIKKFIPAMTEGKNVVIGTRKGKISMVGVHQPWHRELLGKGFTLFTQVLLNTYVSDFTCGFKAFSMKAKDAIFNDARINRWSYDAEILFLAKRAGYDIVEVPVKWNDRSGSKVKLQFVIFETLFDLFRIRYYQVERAVAKALDIRLASEV